jgi:AcrR family transcriptional regulator
MPTRQAKPATESKSRRRARNSEVISSTRELILTAAHRLFAEQGFSTVSMPVIAKASGITAGAIYKHFESKAELFFEVVRRAVRTTALVETSAEQIRLPEIVANYATHKFKMLRQLAVEVHYTSRKHSQVRRLLRHSLDTQIQEIADYLAAEQRAGKVVPSLDPKLLASTVLVFIMGLMHMETLAPQLVDSVPWRELLRDRVAALLGMHV